MLKREWGGCLPYDTWVLVPSAYRGWPVQAYNTGRSAIYAAALSAGASRVWLPYYLCPTVRDFLILMGMAISEYHIDENFMPEIDATSLRRGDVVVWTNWLGCVPSSTKDAVVERFDARLIIDNCHACFDEPIHGAYNVFALRKVIGIPHGAYLVADELAECGEGIPYESIDSGLAFLDRSSSDGANAAYIQYGENSERIGFSFKRMHPFVQAACAGLDLEEIACARRRNFAVLREELGDSLAAPWFDLDEGTPIWFPLYCEDDGLRQRLLENCVWVPRLWKRIFSTDEATEIELSLARWLLPLPIDQRYGEEDMIELSRLVKRLVHPS